jgi:8-amino-7-oxononanoate synthase
MLAAQRQVRSLADLLEQRAADDPDRAAYTFLLDGEAEAESITYAELERRAVAIAAAVRERCQLGDRVVILLPPGIDFIAAFLACSYAGVVAVPAFRPTPARLGRMLPKLARIAADSGAAAVLTQAALRDRVRTEDEPELPSLEWLAVDALADGAGNGWQRPAVSADDLALLQYTSGSTAQPKGVMVTQGNLLANLAFQQRQFRIDPSTEGVMWVPPYHDLGLVGGILLSLYNGNHVTLMSPWHFLQRPYRWLEALSRTRSSHTGAPNFALELCVRRTTEEERAALDLSSVRMLLSGGEPVRADTLERFARAFAVAGFDPSAFSPAYGLAEATLMVASVPLGRAPTRRAFDARALRDGVARPSTDGNARRVIVGCGSPGSTDDVRIVHPETGEALPPGRVGEIWLRGPSVARGYWNRPELTERVFRAHPAGSHEPFLRTGDLGFLLEDELFVAGRLKDVIIIHGRNYHPQDIEETVERAHPALVPGGGAAFGVDHAGEERLVVLHEVETGAEVDVSGLPATVQEAVALDHEVTLDRLVLVRAGTVPRTPNGKVRRGAARLMLGEGALAPVLDWRSPRLAVAEQEGEPEPDESGAARWIAEEVGRLAGGAAGQIALDAPLSGLGLDSVQIADLVQRIEAEFGVALPLTDVPREISIAALADAVAGRPLPEAESGDGAAPADAVAPTDGFRELPEFQELETRLSLFGALGIANPFFKVHGRVARSTALVEGRELVNFASYNYLALSGDPEVSAAAKRAIDDFGTSVSASRLVSGERPLHLELEHALARFVGAEDAVVFVSGNLANVSTLGHLVGARDLVVHDALAHDSIVQGAILSGATRRSFPHNDWQALDRLLAAVRDRYERVLVAVEGVYSMDGDIPDLPRFVEVKDRHRAFLMVDEAHSLGVLGSSGRGVAEHFGVDPARVEIWMGTLSKSLASCGGYIAGAAPLVHYLKYSAPGFVFSVGISPPNAAAALAALRRLEAEPELVERLQARARLFLELAADRGLDTGRSEGFSVIPVIFGSSEAAVQASNRMLERGFNVQPIVYPAVEEGLARLRFFLCADHTEDQIRAAVDAVAEVAAELGAGSRHVRAEAAPEPGNVGP